MDSPVKPESDGGDTFVFSLNWMLSKNLSWTGLAGGPNPREMDSPDFIITGLKPLGRGMTDISYFFCKP
jgi:hypothetical protein